MKKVVDKQKSIAYNKHIFKRKVKTMQYDICNGQHIVKAKIKKFDNEAFANVEFYSVSGESLKNIYLRPSSRILVDIKFNKKYIHSNINVPYMVSNLFKQIKQTVEVTGCEFNVDFDKDVVLLQQFLKNNFTNTNF